MKTISGPLATHLAGNPTTLATLWKITRLDTVVLGFTDHDQAITFNDGSGSVTYTPVGGATASATDFNSDMAPDNMELVGFLESDSITDADIRAGKYDYSVITVMVVNYADLTQGFMPWKTATLGPVKMKNGQYTAELRGLAFHLSTNIGETFGPICRVDLGGARCTVNLATYSQSGSVSTVTDLRTFVPASGLKMIGSPTPTVAAPSGWFTDGVITWTSGANNGYSMEVGSWNGTTMALFQNMPNAIAPGDTFTITPGCNHLSGANGDCQNKFVNIENFRGEPFIPGMDQILLYPNASGAVPQ
jgi:uncharacterized phage protein (TIGR02218 family)